jgi:ABC-type nitrate/sulfonate/bicarbonate transport system permease component
MTRSTMTADRTPPVAAPDETGAPGFGAKLGWVARTGLRQVLITALPIVALFVIWQLVVSLAGYSPAILPGPIAVFESIGRMAADGILLSDAGVSFYRMAIGLLVGVPLGTVLGLAMGVSRWSERGLAPLMDFGLATPGIAFIPLAILWFGLTDLTVISILILEVVLVVMLTTWTSVRGVEPALLNAARTMGVTGPALFGRVLFPASLLGIIGGYRMAFSRAWRVLVAGEMLAGVSGGLGFRIDESRTSFQADRVYAGIIVIGVVGVLLERFVLRSLEAMTVDRWEGKSS